MPLYGWKLKSGEEVEVYKPMSQANEPPEPGAVRLFGASTVIHVTHADSVVGKTKNRPAVKRRMGSGVATLNTDTGGYRPALTHQAFCPNCNAWRMTAMLYQWGPGGNKSVLNCECGYQWAHLETHADGGDPIIEKYDGALRPGNVAGSAYEAPVRGV